MLKSKSDSRDLIKNKISYYFFRDKAGGYGIQAKGGTLIERVNGDYFNVMGFPLHRFSRKLLDMYGDHLHWHSNNRKKITCSLFSE